MGSEEWQDDRQVSGRDSQNDIDTEVQGSTGRRGDELLQAMDFADLKALMDAEPPSSGTTSQAGSGSDSED
jgi:hypothetical protein